MGYKFWEIIEIFGLLDHGAKIDKKMMVDSKYKEYIKRKR